MTIEIEKPAPLMIGNKAYYTLTSYDPIHIEVEVPATTDADVDLAIDSMVAEAGGTAEDLANDAWVAEHFDGVASADELRRSVYNQITDMSARVAEDQKVGLCVSELAKRLKQAVPPAHIAEARVMVEAQFAQSLAADGLTRSDFLSRTGTSEAALDAMFERQAKSAAEGNAALDAFAHERKLTVDDSELPRLLRVPLSEAEKIIEQARAAGQYEQLKEAALRNKAAETLVAECACTYKHETAEEAQARAAQMREMREKLAAKDQDSNPAGLHLV